MAACSGVRVPTDIWLYHNLISRFDKLAHTAEQVDRLLHQGAIVGTRCLSDIGNCRGGSDAGGDSDYRYRNAETGAIKHDLFEKPTSIHVLYLRDKAT